jgi:medium-chain acyl-[acyl-carrier-protein] hydrolase
MGEKAFTRIKPLVAAVASAIGPEVQVPYALYGHSMGAIIGFELARELASGQGKGPEHLFVSGRRAPQWPNTEPPSFHLPHDEFIAELKRLKGTPDEVLAHPELMELFLSLLRADFELVDTYEFKPGQLLSCPITVYGGLSDEHVPAESCRAWREQTSGVCRTRMVQGDHFFVRQPGPDFVNSFRQDVLSVASARRVQEF